MQWPVPCRVAAFWCAETFSPERRRAYRRALVFGPAVLLILSLLLLAFLLGGPSSSITTWYQRRAEGALTHGDYATARLCYASLLQRQPDSLAAQYGLAMSLAGLHEDAAASMLIRQLAPDGPAAGYPPAHLYVAERILRDPSPTPEALRIAESHLLRVIKTRLNDDRAHALLAVIYANTGQWDLVKEHLSLSGSPTEELALAAAETFSSRGDTVEAQRWARRAAALYAPHVKSEPRNNALRMSWAQATSMTKDYPATVAILKAGWTQTHDPMYRHAIAEVMAIWLKNEPEMEASRRFPILEAGLGWDGQNTTILLAVLDLASTSTADQATPTTAPTQGAAARALCASVAAARTRQTDRLRSELERALSLSPVMLPIAANVACAWAYGNDADASAALVLSTALLELRPREPVAQRAQGLVLVCQQKWAQSVNYLEASLAAMPDDPTIHKALASAYEKLGKSDQAARHRPLADLAAPPATLPSFGISPK